MTNMLDGKVVVISGVGPGLGTTLARRCAKEGADLVLAARSVDRLDDVAKQVIDLGRKAVAVRTDITDDDQVSNLVDATLEAYGKADVLINNAFRVPSMKPLAGTSFQHIRDAIELSALGALRLIQGFTPALAESKGSVVNVNSMVIRHSQAKYGAYKMAKSALLSMSQSLATELGEQGIRVNSVAPGYIWGDTLQGYFNHQAGKYGTTAEQIYQATAANSDLKRLPTEDEVASAILFMASDLSSGITGQTLDVNCGEYHSLMATRTDVGTVDDLHASATKLTGLDDFGSDDDNYREALGVLLDSYQREAGLTVLGSKMNRFFLRGALVARLLSESAWKQYPAYADVPVQQPDLRDRAAAHRHHRLAPAAGRRPGPSGPAPVAGRVPAAASAARHLGIESVVSPAGRAVHPAPRGEPGVHRPAFHGRLRAGGVLAAAAAVAAFGVLRDACAPAELRAVVVAAGLDAVRISGTAATCS